DEPALGVGAVGVHVDQVAAERGRDEAGGLEDQATRRRDVAAAVIAPADVEDARLDAARLERAVERVDVDTDAAVGRRKVADDRDPHGVASPWGVASAPPSPPLAPVGT